MKYLILGLIKLYKRFFARGLNTNCRYYPTCSIYGMQAIEEWGTIVGGALAVARVARCNPFSKGGYNSVKRSRSKRKWLL